jgi:hypothetical protein
MYSRSWISLSSQESSRVIRVCANAGDAGSHDESLPVLGDLLDHAVIAVSRGYRGFSTDAHRLREP